MFKHFLIILVIIIIIIVSYYFIKSIMIKYHKLYLNESIIKYPFTDTDKSFFDKNNITVKLSELKDKSVFYISSIWSTKNNNYIHDTIDNRYYIIDRGYYYYIPSLDRYSINIGKDIYVKLLYL